MIKPKIALISTGGTIAMRFDPQKNGMVPAVTGQELIDAVPSIADICELEVIDFANIPSAHMSPSHMKLLAQHVETALLRTDIKGVVITHGTDTLEETAYFLSLYLSTGKAVCLTAAMRTSSELSPDGPNNILSAIRVICDKQAVPSGVMVVMNNEIHCAADVTKTHTGNVKTFASPFWGPIGYVDNDRIITHHTPHRHEQIRAQHVDAKVPILKAFTGMDKAWVQAVLFAQPLDGLIIEGFGRGNFPESILEPVQSLIDQNIPVVVTSRTLGGRVLDVYAAPAAGADLKKRGAILAGELSSQKARLKLILALGTQKSMEEIKTLF